MADASYQTGVYHKREGDVMVVASGGEIEVESGGILHIDDGSYLYFDSSSYALTQAQLRHLLYDAVTVSIVGQGAVSTVFSVVNMANSVKYYIFSMTSTCVNASAALTSGPVVGQERVIVMRPGSCVSGIITIYPSGCSLVTALGLDNSKMILYNSAASVGIVRLACFKDGEWSVVGINSATAVTFT